jgi:anti-sigma B factor antagonist
MKTDKNKANKKSFKLPLQGEMTIYQAADLKSVLLDSLAKAPRLEIDLSAVSEIDTAGIQLLMMLKKAAMEKKTEVQLTAHSPAVLDAFELVNLAAFFGDPMVIQSAEKSSANRSSERQ